MPAVDDANASAPTASVTKTNSHDTSMHARNKTGLVGKDRAWSHDPQVNRTWQSLTDRVQQQDTVEQVQEAVVRHATNTLARTHFNMDNQAGYQAAAHAVRDRLIARWNATQQHHTSEQVKRVYYLSLEFLLGRSLQNACLNLGVEGQFGEALRGLGFSLERLYEEEVDAALGNGGLGRLAACFMDSLATLDLPAWGYGLRYQYGIFQQQIINGQQVEFPDYWLNFGNAWEVPRMDVVYDVLFYGHVVNKDPTTMRAEWLGGETVEAVAYDVPIPGFQTNTCINIRLWGSKPQKRFDLQSFNDGNYQQSVDEQQRAEHITSVLYPNDNTMAGKELRLKQQYFFVSATLQDILRRFKKVPRPWSALPDQAAIQLNDTHPSLGIAELMRQLVDLEGLPWDQAWSITTRVFSFTNHTVLPEAMEKWPVDMMTALLPRHMQIIYDINLFFLQAVERRFPGDRARLARMSIIEETPHQQVRMAYLAVVGSHCVNGVAKIHSDLIKETCFKDFVDFFGPSHFQNKTNGITPRRWLHQANPELSQLITDTLGSDKWLTDLSLLSALLPHQHHALFRQQWRAVKHRNKERLARLVEERCGVRLDPRALFDVQVKRIHEYKRQFMNILGVIYRYLRIKQGTNLNPRVFVFGGKAAPGYFIAKLVIRLICAVSAVINTDPDIHDSLKVVFIPDYNVSVAETIIPASDLSEHISTAGTEASGTSNMKFVLNGGLIIGTMDGANIEIREEIRSVSGRDDCMFVFGATADTVDDIRHRQRYGEQQRKMPEELQCVLQAIRSGRFGDSQQYRPLLDTLIADHYLIAHDFSHYLASQAEADRVFADQEEWCRRSIAGAAAMGKFSSDRSISEYARDIWHLTACRPPSPSPL